MKILQVLCGGAWGGGSVVVLHNIEALIRRGDEVWVITADDEQTRCFQRVGATVVQLRSWRRHISPRDVVPFVQLFRLCRREKFDLVATHTSKAGFIGRLAAKAAGVRHVVHHAHGFAFRETQPKWVQRCYVFLERIAAHACDLIISVSEDHRQAGIRKRVACADKIVTVLNGIELDAFGRTSVQVERGKLGFEAEDVLIGVAGRFAPKKGLEDLIRAFPEIHKAHPKARLVLVGDGPSRPGLEKIAQRIQLGRQIHFTGFRNDIPDLLSAFDVVVQPSISEGLSLSIIEPMAAGKPIVACNIEGNREIITSRVNGLLVPPSDPAALAAAVGLLLKDPEYARALGKAAQDDCRERFSKARMVRQTVKLYDVVAAGKPVNDSLRAWRIQEVFAQHQAAGEELVQMGGRRV